MGYNKYKYSIVSKEAHSQTATQLQIQYNKGKSTRNLDKKLSKTVQEFERWSFSDQSTTFITSRYTFPKRDDDVAEE